MSILVYDETQLREPNLLVPEKKPIGPVQLRAGSPRFTFFYLFNAGGGSVVRDLAGSNNGELIYTGSDITYLEWHPEGLANNSYDGDYTDGAAVKVSAGHTIDVTSFIMGWQERYTGGGYSFENGVGIGDYWAGDALADGYGSYNSMYWSYHATNDKLAVKIGNRSPSVISARLKDYKPHTYVAYMRHGPTYSHATVYRDGVQIFEDLTIDKTSYVRGNDWCVAAPIETGHHNRGLNGVWRSAFVLEGAQCSSILARELSHNPFQFLEPA